MPVGAGTVGPGISSPGKGGSVPKNLIVGGASTSIASIEIPGLSGSADIIPASPSAFNDEFDEDGSGIPAGWTALPFGTLSIANTDDFLSNLHLKTSLTTGILSGLYKAGPTSFPFTMTAKLTDAMVGASTDASGIFVSPVVPGNAGSMYCVQIAQSAAGTPPRIAQVQTANASTGASGGGSSNNSSFGPPCYLQLVVTSTTVTYLVSFSGMIFTQIAQTTGLVFATPTIGLFVTSNGASAPNLGEAAFDWIRFH